MKITAILVPMNFRSQRFPAGSLTILTIALAAPVGCQSYQYDSIPNRLQLSPVRCDDIWVGNKLRNDWTYRNSNWLKKTVGDSYKSESAQRAALAKIEARLGDRFYADCTIGYTIFKSNNGFSNANVRFSNMTSELSFVHSPQSNQLCLHSYPTIYREDQYGASRVHVAFDPNAIRTCIVTDLSSTEESEPNE